MKWLKQNAVMILASVIFALFAGMNIGAYASDVDSRQAQELQGDHLLRYGDALPVTAYVESRAPAQNISSRVLRSVFLDGLGGRSAYRGIAGWHDFNTLRNTEGRIVLRSEFPTALTFSHPKEYYVYTLERILC
ncbi:MULTISPECIES: hypothetical protein [unclassified Fibrobacter]|uniref:hypothetical protein n=1 Tax=unclassified Fibrobacter TaxID=2634177 RepID=UPI000D7A17F4|nr:MULTISPECIES: hypothetical protein [unclassified Fibrobacter]PWJ64926.1 hypothetical protein BGX12_11429 [Fibrobacter sp. UWR4]PZW68991.1 hypothetical protein C8E88_101723 [Fibrobacter sp. UWR1]